MSSPKFSLKRTDKCEPWKLKNVCPKLDRINNSIIINKNNIVLNKNMINKSIELSKTNLALN